MIVLRAPAVRPRLAFIALLAIVLSLTGGCSGGGKQYIDMMALVPVDATEYHYWAVDQLGADDHLWPLYKLFRDSGVAIQLGDFEPVLAVVKNSAKASGFDGSVSVLRGDFNFKDLERRMRDQGYVQTVYHDVAIWTPEGSEEGDTRVSVVLREGAVLMGATDDLKACLDVVKLDQENCLNEDQTIRWVTDRLPEGIIVDVIRAGPGSSENYADLISYGRSYSKADEDKLRMTAMYMFRDGYAAGPAQDGIRAYLSGRGYTNVETEQEGNFIRVTGLANINDFAKRISY